MNAARTRVEAFYRDVWNRREASAISALLHEDFTFRGSLGQTRRGHAAFLRGRALRAGRLLSTCRAEVFALRDEGRALIAEMTSIVIARSAPG